MLNALKDYIVSKWFESIDHIVYLLLHFFTAMLYEYICFRKVVNAFKVLMSFQVDFILTIIVILILDRKALQF